MSFPSMSPSSPSTPGQQFPNLNRSGIYMISSPSGKSYIGSSINIRRRWWDHCSSASRGKHSSFKFQRAWNKYGRDCLKLQVLELCDKTNLIAREQYWIDLLKPTYNVSLTAIPSYIRTPEILEKLSKSNKGKKHSIETRQKISRIQLGNQKARGHILSLESKQQISNTKKKQKDSVGIKNPSSKLTEAQVRTILESSLRGSVLAKKYNVTHSNICRIKSRKTWKFLNVPE